MPNALGKEHQSVSRSEVIKWHQLHQQAWGEGERCSEKQPKGGRHRGENPVAFCCEGQGSHGSSAEDKTDCVKVANGHLGEVTDPAETNLKWFLVWWDTIIFRYWAGKCDVNDWQGITEYRMLVYFQTMGSGFLNFVIMSNIVCMLIRRSRLRRSYLA